MTWTDQRVERLTELWAEGLSAGLIAKKLDLSKNAIVGKAHRLKLAGRPSPIIRDGSTAESRRKEALARPAPVRSKTPEPPASEVAVSLSRRTCLFIEGEKGRDFTRWADAPRCGVPARVGSPYCRAHHRRCHLRRQPSEAA